MKKFFILFCFLILSLPSKSQVKDIKVFGVKRISPDMVKNVINLKEDEKITDKKLNDIVRKLYNTGYFSDVKLSEKNNILEITVAENPTVNAVSFEGYSDLKLDDIKKDVKTRPHSIYNPAQIKSDVETIKNLYKRLGNFKAVVDAKIIERDNNQYDVVFEITEGKKAYIKDITFNGNESFSPNELQEVILSKEYSWWKLLEMYDTYDEDRLLYDSELLKNFYNLHGFLDFRVESQSAKMDLSESNFYVVFNLNEGKRYKVGDISISSEIPDLDTDTLNDKILLKQSRFYDDNLANKSIVDIAKKMGENGFAFIDVDIEKKPNPETGIVDIVFKIKNSRRAFINKIDIKNNTRTYDKVIRRNLNFDEQDIYNSARLKSSEQKLYETGFFESVKISPKPVFGVPDKVNIDVNVAEKSTGELSLGAGWSSLNKGFLEFGIKENNFMGKGQTLGFTSTFSGTQNNFSLSFVEPYLFDRDLMGGIDAYYSQYKYSSTYGYDIDTIGLAFKLGWNYNDHLSQRFRLSGKNEKMTNISDSLSSQLLEGVGDYNVFKLGQTITYRDQTIDFVNDTRQGYIVSYSTDYAGFGGDKYFIKNDISAKQTFSFWDNVWQLGISFYAGKIHSLDGTTLSRSDRYLLGGDSLRGFEYGGIGARSATNTNYAYGGNWEVNGTFQFNFPIGIPKKYKISGYIFYDWGKLGRPVLADYSNVLYSGKVRTSVGYGISWNSPIGAINVSWAYPLSYEEYDKRQRFRFSIGTGF
ncbi:MAG: outer membrane protein assembly factor BamA [Alphaproteobacteria bacterium]|nr:outer membrane protein assembly factor BamA [Alphaproteobacteria bacterium]